MVKTVLKPPKYSDLNYGQFRERAKHDPDFLKYANYISESFGPYAKNRKATSYTQGVDFAHYLCRVKFTSQHHGAGGFKRELPKWMEIEEIYKCMDW